MNVGKAPCATEAFCRGNLGLAWSGRLRRVDAVPVAGVEPGSRQAADEPKGGGDNEQDAAGKAVLPVVARDAGGRV